MIRADQAMIPVADDPLATESRASHADQRRARDTASPGAEGDRSGIRHMTLILLLFLNAVSFMGVFSSSTGILYQIGVIARFGLWPLILGMTILHIATRGVHTLFLNLIPVLPFFAVGVVAGLIGFDAGLSLRLLTFWFLGVLSAAVLGAELRSGPALRALFWVMMATMVGSVLLSVFVPSLAVGVDSRGFLGSGSWSGVFAGKNALGWFTGYALIFAVFAPRVPLLWRVALGAVTLVCLVFSGSQGSLVIAVAGAAFVGVIWLLRQTALSSGARAALLLTIVILTIPLATTLSSLVLEALGRDTTLTGRTDIWRLYFGRAVEYWLIGAGPGAFTTGSVITADLTASLTSFGIIRTPHNMFIATFGEIGIFGLIAYVGVLGYAAFVLPFRNMVPVALPTSATAFITMLGGLGETREVFGPAFAMFLLVLMLSLGRKDASATAVPEADDDRAPTASATTAPQGFRIPVLG